MPETKNPTRVPDAFVFFAALLLFLAFGRANGAGQVRELERGLWQFDEAEFTKSELSKRPPAEATWQEVGLPESWRQTLPGYVGQVWYRMSIDLKEIRWDPYAIYLPHRRAKGLLFYVNGTLVGADLQRTAFGAWYAPQYHVVPPSLLRKGTNVIEIAMTGEAEARNGLGRVAFGYENPVRQLHRWQNNVENTYQSGQMIALFPLGLLGLALWLARRADRVVFWYALACLVWSIGFAVRVATLGLGMGTLNQVTAFLASSLTPLFTVVLCIRIGNRRFPLLEGTLWTTFLAMIAWMIVDPAAPKPTQAWQNICTFLVAASACWLVLTQRRRLGWSLYVFVASVVLSVFFPVHDVLRDAGILDLDRASMRHYQTIDLIVGLGAIVIERYLAATRATEIMNVELERRVAEKTLEIEDGARRMQAIRDEQALAVERERILADMHDGVGASLVALTHVAQDDSVSREELARRAREALQDLRMAIDSLEPYEGDLGTVLGNMRERLGQSVEASGIRLEWAVRDLPTMKRLTPSVVLDVQRIVYEVVTNAVRHSRARRVRVSAEPGDGGTILLCVEDDGSGFDSASLGAGHGMRNMKRRAARLGAKLDIRSGPNGSSIVLELPADPGLKPQSPAKESSDRPILGPNLAAGLIPSRA